VPAEGQGRKVSAVPGDRCHSEMRDVPVLATGLRQVRFVRSDGRLSPRILSQPAFGPLTGETYSPSQTAPDGQASARAL
jgi:hypothetical protein